MPNPLLLRFTRTPGKILKLLFRLQPITRILALQELLSVLLVKLFGQTVAIGLCLVVFRFHCIKI